MNKVGHACAEWHRLTDVLIHRPGVEMFYGLLEPYDFLYERAFSMEEAVHEHQELEHALNQSGVRVHKLREVTVEIARTNPKLLERLRKQALGIVKFKGSKGNVRVARHNFKKNLEILDTQTVFDIMLLRPCIRLEKRSRNRTIYPYVMLDVPLANLYFLRDQQALTDRGFIIGRMARPQRRMEPVMTKTILELMGARVSYHVQTPGTFEGGDFIPADRFALLGLGDRTNRNAVNQLLEKGTLGFEEVAIVHQASHPLIPDEKRDPMVNMHLDTYLNFAAQNVAVGCLPLLRRSRVEVYGKNAHGSYRRQAVNINVHDYLVQKRIKIVPITTLEQMCYASNFLCTKDRNIIAIEVEKVAEKVLKNLQLEAKEQPDRYDQLFNEAKKEYRLLKETGQFFPHKKEIYELGIEVSPLLLEEITGGYGGAHCMTCILNRDP